MFGLVVGRGDGHNLLLVSDKHKMTAEETSEKMYDVIICGTDLIQSILSSALSRAGKKVLHCDGNDWYGGFDAVLYGGSTLDCFVESCMDNQRQEDGEGKNATEANHAVESSKNKDFLPLLPKEKYASLRLHSQTILCQDNNKSATVDATEGDNMDAPNLENLTIQIDAVEGGEDDKTNDATNNDQLDGFTLDISPCLLYASGDAVEGLVKSGVSDYLEFKSVEGLFVLMTEDESSKTCDRRLNRHRNNIESEETTGRSDVAQANAKSLTCYRVPCSKGDVFRSKLLSPVDKRRLMKFLQLVTDYGMVMASKTSKSEEQSTFSESSIDAYDVLNHNEEEIAANTSLHSSTNNDGEDAIQSINERHLHRGRALSRPQNKAAPSLSDMESLIRCVRDGVSFSEFLRTVAKLPDRLAIVVVYALALTPFGYNSINANEPTSDAMARVSNYSTKEGVEDLLLHVTALGRFGHTAFLTTMYGSGELSQAFCRSGAVYGSTYMLRRSPLRITLEKNSQVRGVVLGGEGHIGGLDDLDTTEASDQEILCEHVIVPSSMIDPSLFRNTGRTRVYRRISILSGKLVTADEERNNTDDILKTEQRYAIVIPPGTHGLANPSAIHAVAVDDSVFVAPRRKQYTVLHLTMSISSEDGNSNAFDDNLGQAVQYLIASQPFHRGTSNVKECHHITFSFTSDSPNLAEDDQTSGLHIAYRGTQSLTCDFAFREAKRIFNKICPGSDFLGLAKKVEDEIVYRNGEDSDDERVVLDSAVTMIEAP